MAWSAPMTAVHNGTFLASEYNAQVRDNLLETMPAKATAADQYFAVTGANAIAARATGSTYTTGSSTTTSTTYADLLSGAAPAVTITTGVNALVWGTSEMRSDTVNTFCAIGVAVSGASTVAADDIATASIDGVTAANNTRTGFCHLFTGLTPGSNTFTMKYKTSAGTATFGFRELIVMPF